MDVQHSKMKITLQSWRVMFHEQGGHCCGVSSSVVCIFCTENTLEPCAALLQELSCA